MANLLEFLRKLSDGFSELSQGKKIAALVLVAAGTASVFVMFLWLKAPDFQLLYANLSEGDAAAIVDELKTQNIPFELSNQGRTVRVPSPKVAELRLEMATKGLPAGSEVGLEIFDKTGLGMTEFMQKLNFQRALQGELSRTIQTLDAVSQARVHVVIPKATLFLREKPKGKASVTLKLKPGNTLNENQIQGIVHLVASSVEGINAEDVVILDMQGNLLSGGKGPSSEAIISATNFKYKTRVQEEMESNILKMLEEALGPGKVIARVTADLDFEKVERTEETFDPDSQVVRSEQLVTESTVGSLPPGGVAGVQGLLPTGETQAATPGSAARRNKENQTFNYEINKVIQRVSKPLGEIKKLSVAVLIDGTYTGDPPEYQARTEEEMAKYRDLIQSAVGYDEKRGDQIKVENVQFDRSLMQENKQQMARAEIIDLALQVAKYLLGAIFIVLFFARVIRPMVRWMTTTVEVVPQAPAQLTTADMDAIEVEKKRLEELGTESMELRQTVTDFVKTDPKYTSGIIRKWMREK